jgi:hypothetical protein
VTNDTGDFGVVYRRYHRGDDGRWLFIERTEPGFKEWEDREAFPDASRFPMAR